MSKTKAVVVKEEAPVPAHLMEQMEAQAGAGFENASSSDFLLPIVQIVQGQSKMKDDDNGIREGVFYNTATEQVYAEGLEMVLVHYRHLVIQWGPERGQFRSELPLEHGLEVYSESGIDFLVTKDVDPRDMENFEQRKKNCDRLAETFVLFILYRPIGSDEDFRRGVLSLGSTTTYKDVKKILGKLNDLRMDRKDGGKFTPPVYVSLIDLTSENRKNDKGNWKGYKFNRTGYLSEEQMGELVPEAMNFATVIKAGDAQADYAKADESGSTSAGDKSSEDIEEKPFGK